MALDEFDIEQQLLKAMKGTLKEQWPAVKTYAECEAKKLAKTIASASKKTTSGELTPEEYRHLLEAQIQTSKSVFLKIEGVSLIASEQLKSALSDAASQSASLLSEGGGSRDH